MTNKWSKLDVSWLVLALFIVIAAIVCKYVILPGYDTSYVLSVMSNLSAIFGVIYVILIAKQERMAYFFGIGNVVLYAITVYNKGLYISAGYNLLYSLPVLIYGYIYWGKLEEKGESGIKYFSGVKRFIGIILMSFAVIVLAFISEKILGGNNALLDSITSVCVCVATFLLAKKYIEQWWLFIVSNFMGIILFFPKSFSDIISIDLFAMWVVYFINSIYGYISWKKSLGGKKG